MAIYNDDKVIGFSMYCKDPDDERYWIYVFMIDEGHQGKGYGKQGLIRLMEWMKKENNCTEIIIGHKPDNLKAEYLYTSVGFRNTGEIINDEIIKKYNFDGDFEEVGHFI
jgi:diamine N-acetyltransferase